MKKYIKPQCKVIEVATANIIATSVGVYNTNVDTYGDYETYEQF